MADPNISAWRTEVGYYVPGVDNAETDNAVVSAVIDFCNYTKLWVEKLTPINIEVLENKEDIAFTDDDPDTITYTAGDFTDYFAAGDIIVTDSISTSSDPIGKNNTGPYLITTSAGNTLTLDSAEAVDAEEAGVSTTISKSVYPLSYSGADIVEVTDAKIDGQTLIPKGEGWLDKYIPLWRTAMSINAKYFTVDRKNNLRIVPVPSAKILVGLEVWAALKPSRTASADTITPPTTVEPFIFTDWFNAIADGAVYRLLAMTSKPWRDFGASEFYFNRFEAAKREGAGRTRLGFSEAENPGMIA